MRRHARLHVLVVHASALLTLGAAAASAQAPTSPARVVIVQESNGFPGGEQVSDPSQLARQKLTVVGERLRVLDEQHGWALFVSIPDKKVHEVSVASREYVERSFDFYAKYRDSRAKNLEAMAREFQQAKRNLDGPRDQNDLRKLIFDYTREGGDPNAPGKIVARTQRFPQDVTTTTILIDRVPTVVRLDHVVIRENQAATPAFDLWVTQDVSVPVDMFAFWRQLGTFAPEVSQALQQVKGTPIRCTALLDTGTFKRRFESRVLEIRTKDPGLTDQDVTLPAGFRPQQEQAAGPGSAWCAMTGVRLGPDQLGFNVVKGGRTYYAATLQLHKQLRTLLLEKNEKPPFADGPARPAGPPAPDPKKGG